MSCPELSGTLAQVNVRYLIDAITRSSSETACVSLEFGFYLQSLDPQEVESHIEPHNEKTAIVYRKYKWNELQCKKVEHEQRAKFNAEKEKELSTAKEREVARAKEKLDRFHRIQSLMADLRKSPMLGKLGGEYMLKVQVECLVDCPEIADEELAAYVESNNL